MDDAIGKRETKEVPAREAGPGEAFPVKKTKRGVAMQQEISMVYLNERVPFPRYFTPSDLRSLLGESYGAALRSDRAGEDR